MSSTKEKPQPTDYSNHQDDDDSVEEETYEEYTLRLKQAKQHEEFLANERLKSKIWAKERKEKLQKKAEAKAKRDKQQCAEFNLRYEQAKKDQLVSASCDVSSIATKDSISTSNHPAPVKKKRNTSQKKLPKQKNTLAGYVKKLDASLVASGTVVSSIPSASVVAHPPKSVTVGVEPDVSYTTPKADRVPPAITPYMGNNIDSSHLVDLTQSGAGVDHLRICSGCKNPFSSCYKGKWCRICLHCVLDYIEEKDFKDATEKGIRKVYYNTFVVMMKLQILDDTDLHELEDHLHLPLCMKEGSLNEALELMNFDYAYEYMKLVCVHDVQRHLAKRNGIFCGECKEGERIVDVRRK